MVCSYNVIRSFMAMLDWGTKVKVEFVGLPFILVEVVLVIDKLVS